MNWNNRRTDYVIVAVSFLLLAAYWPRRRQIQDDPRAILQRTFDRFLEQYDRAFRHDTDSAEYRKAFEAFKASLQRISRLNDEARRSGRSALYGLTRFSDMTPEEFAGRHLLVTRKPGRKVNVTSAGSLRPLLTSRSTTSDHSTARLPTRVDWREGDFVSAVGDQKQCGACWAFSTVQTLESMIAISNGSRTHLSTQQLIDCSSENLGCQGGDICSALEWMSSNPVVTERLYPLNLQDNQCRPTSDSGGVRLRRYVCTSAVGDGMEEAVMLPLLASHGPLAVAVDATSWQDYVDGVITHNCEKELNHAVQIVGYDLSGADGRPPFYIVRNSWGRQFGLDGYLHIAVGHNLCGVAEEIGYISV